jgi:hypothetical protein
MRWRTLAFGVLVLWAAPVEAAFTVTCTSQKFTTATTAHVVTLPATLDSGDLIFISLAVYGGSASTVTNPTGFTELEELDKSNQIKLVTSYKWSDGTEDGGSADYETSAGQRAVASVCRIQGALSSTNPEKGTAGTGVSVNPDPPSVTASWGAEANLFLATYAQQNSLNPASSQPTNYTLQASEDADSVVNPAGGGVASRELTAASDDPDTWTLVENDDWIAQTIVIRPAAAASGPCTMSLLGVGRACN